MTQRLGAYAAKRKVMIGYHNHTQVNFNSRDTALSQSKYNGINFDVGHFAAAVSQSPIPLIQKHHDRITCLHLKDRKFGANGGQNMPWGQGDTPLKKILVTMQKEKYKFPAGIELERSRSAFGSARKRWREDSSMPLSPRGSRRLRSDVSST